MNKPFEVGDYKVIASVISTVGNDLLKTPHPEYAMAIKISTAEVVLFKRYNLKTKLMFKSSRTEAFAQVLHWLYRISGHQGSVIYDSCNAGSWVVQERNGYKETIIDDCRRIRKLTIRYAYSSHYNYKDYLQYCWGVLRSM
jgi:hypothetical protein